MDNDEQTGAYRPHSTFRVLFAPIISKCGSGFRVEIEREKLGELLDAKWAGSYCNALEEPVCVFPVLIADFFQRAIVCLVERLR